MLVGTMRQTVHLSPWLKRPCTFQILHGANIGPHKVALSHFQVVAISEPSECSCCPSHIATTSTQFENEVRPTCIFRKSQSETI